LLCETSSGRDDLAPRGHRRGEFVTPARNFVPDAGGTNTVPYMRNFVRRGVKITTMTGVSRLERHNNRIKATLWTPFTMADCGERMVDMVVVENATIPLASYISR
jgi:N-methyl-L-proline demethylase